MVTASRRRLVRARCAGAGVLVVVLALLGACTTGQTYEPVGLTRPKDDARSLVALYLTCGDEKVEAVSLYPDSGDGNADHSRTLWRIEGLDSGGNAPEYVVGRAPPGFLLSQRLEQPPVQKTPLVIEFETSKGTAALAFTPGEVDQEKVYTRNTEGEVAMIARDTFGARSQRLCAQP
ncbi:MAG: hypothetical protein U0U69_04630 [Acidimicrobiia bacterium]